MNDEEKSQLTEEQSHDVAVKVDADVPKDGAAVEKEQSAAPTKMSKVIDVALTALIVLMALFLLFRLFFVSSVTVKMTSMEPTLHEGDVVTLNKTAAITRGDVIVFYNEDVAFKNLYMLFSSLNKNTDDRSGAYLLVKRAVALAGDSVWAVRSGDGYQLRIKRADTGEIVDETYYVTDGKAVTIPDTIYSMLGCLEGTSEQNPYVIADGCVFAVGDNRNVSSDSRAFGAVPTSRVVGVKINV